MNLPTTILVSLAALIVTTVGYIGDSGFLVIAGLFGIILGAVMIGMAIEPKRDE